jgi:hypothetical protein
MLDKLFNWGKKESAAPEPDVIFGRYSDNNKTVEKTSRWTDADKLYKDGKFQESIDAFFDYLRDDAADNVILKRETGSANFTFEIAQGSKVVRGSGNAETLQAEVTLAKMPQPSVPVMRRLLEQNFSLYYSRYALDGERLCMRFNSSISAANPNKLYYGMKELATKADRQDDLLVQDFSNLQALDTDHVQELPAAEKKIKYSFTQQWIGETLDYIQTLDADKFSGGISFLLLVLVYRIDYLVRPEGSLQTELEKIPYLYFAKDEKPAIEKNRLMMEAFEKFRSRTEEDFTKHLYRTRSSFAIVAPQVHKSIAETIASSNNTMLWYRDNAYPVIARQICEYGLSFAQYTYSVPKALSQLLRLFMQVNYSDYFVTLGFTKRLYDPTPQTFDDSAIKVAIQAINTEWQKKYPHLNFDTTRLLFTNLVDFNYSFTNEIEKLNFDA